MQVGAIVKEMKKTHARCHRVRTHADTKIRVPVPLVLCAPKHSFSFINNTTTHQQSPVHIMHGQLSRGYDEPSERWWCMNEKKMRSQPLRMFNWLSYCVLFPSFFLPNRTSRAGLHEHLITDKGQRAADVSVRRKKTKTKNKRTMRNGWSGFASWKHPHSFFERTMMSIYINPTDTCYMGSGSSRQKPRFKVQVQDRSQEQEQN